MLASFGAICAAFSIAGLAFGTLANPLQKVDLALSGP